MRSIDWKLLTAVAAVCTFCCAVQGTPPIVFTNTQADCESCCHIVASALVTEEFCVVQGCNKSVDVNGEFIPGQQNFSFDCNDISAVPLFPDRKGCEVGRDFRLLGSSNVNVGFTTQFCNAGAIGASRDPPGTPAGGSIPASACLQCCDTMNDQLDLEVNSFPFANDFFRDSCRDGCNSASACDDFRDADQHKSRLGCALGIDMLQTGATVLREDEIFCDAQGNLKIGKDVGGGDDDGGDDGDVLGIALGATGGVLAAAVLAGIVYRRYNTKEGGILASRVKSDNGWIENVYGRSIALSASSGRSNM